MSLDRFMNSSNQDFILHLVAVLALVIICVFIIVVETKYKTEITDVSLIIGALISIATSHAYKSMKGKDQ